MDRGLLAGRSPITLIAACLYFVSLLSIDRKPAKEIAEIAGCTEATLKNAYRLLWTNRHELGKDLQLDYKVDDLPY